MLVHQQKHSLPCSPAPSREGGEQICSQPLAHLSDNFQLLLLNLVGFLNLPVTFRPVEVVHGLSQPSFVAAVGLPVCLSAGLSGLAHCGVSSSGGGCGLSLTESRTEVSIRKKFRGLPPLHQNFQVVNCFVVSTITTIERQTSGSDFRCCSCSYISLVSSTDRLTILQWFPLMD